ncbi:MAG: TetR/AcrR family transcriptional regulator [Pseudomonadales bacterium]
MDRPKRQKRPRSGRPETRAGKDVRLLLLEASRRLFASHGYQGVSVKAIADQAGVNPAMVHYYFGNKDGLFVAVIEETLVPVLQKARELANITDTESFIRQFLQIYMSTIAANPWLPVLLTREVILPEGRLRERFVGQVVGPLSHKLRGLIETGKHRGEFDKDIDPTLAVINLISLAAFPFLAMPILNKALKVELNDDFVEHLIRHTSRIYLEGIYKRGGTA